jgi:lysophospholipase L1-like esterase
MLAQWRTYAPSAALLLCTVPSSANPVAPIDRSQLLLLNAELRNMASEYPGLHVVDLYAATVDKNGLPTRRFFDADRLHLSRDGYERWKETLTPVMQSAGLR